MTYVSDIFTRKQVLKVRYIVVVPSWLDKYNNCYLLFSLSLTQGDEFSFTKVQDVVTNRSAVLQGIPQALPQSSSLLAVIAFSYARSFQCLACGFVVRFRVNHHNHWSQGPAH